MPSPPPGTPGCRSRRRWMRLSGPLQRSASPTGICCRKGALVSHSEMNCAHHGRDLIGKERPGREQRINPRAVSTATLALATSSRNRQYYSSFTKRRRQAEELHDVSRSHGQENGKAGKQNLGFTPTAGGGGHLLRNSAGASPSRMVGLRPRSAHCHSQPVHQAPPLGPACGPTLPLLPMAAPSHLWVILALVSWLFLILHISPMTSPSSWETPCWRG
ncbi:uncharacterized protein LOC106507937 [Sus scrofa]|uniref:uncharacterized protein LOC106507937 n=1 Tax=Sus scrofa TaxID=9823 RepID=UPI000A2B61CB|nr:uncharacterized protein LOC106507937 [Sus scrofa]